MAILISTFQLQQFPRYQGVPILHQGALCPLDAPQRKNFVPKTSTLPYLIVLLISTFQLFRDIKESKIYIRGPAPPGCPLAKKSFVPEASTLPYLMSFLISTFQLLYVPRYQGGANLHQGAIRPLDAPQRRNILTQSEYFSISNCIFNFNILALVVTEILGGSQLYVREPCASQNAPQRKFF